MPQLSIDDDPIYTMRRLHRMLVGNFVDNGNGIEDHVVSIIADNQDTVPSKRKTSRPQTGHRLGCYWYFKQLFLAHKLPKHPRKMPCRRGCGCFSDGMPSDRPCNSNMSKYDTNSYLIADKVLPSMAAPAAIPGVPVALTAAPPWLRILERTWLS